MATEWRIGHEVHPYQIRYHVHAYARTMLRDDPGEDFDGPCQFFRVNYGSDSRPDYDIICRGVCESDPSHKCKVEVRRLRRGGPRFSVSDYSWKCICPKPKSKKKKKAKAKKKTTAKAKGKKKTGKKRSKAKRK